MRTGARRTNVQRVSTYDVIVIGSGAGGGTLARHLAPSGKRILLLERGDWLTREPPPAVPRAVRGCGSPPGMAYSACIRCQTYDGFPCLVHAKSDAEMLGVRPGRPARC